MIEGIKKIGALFVMLTLVVQLITPFNMNISYAAGVDGLTITHELRNIGSDVENPEEGTFKDSAIDNVTSDDVIEVKLEYSTVGLTKSFYNTQIKYVMPPGTTFVSASVTGHVKDVPLHDPSTRTLTYNLGNDEAILPSGVAGVLIIKFRFNNPSPYPNEKEVPLNESYVTWNVGAIDGALQSFNLDSRLINYILGPSWSITKGSNTTKTIVSDPTVNTIDVPYTIQLSGGNINLKDVVITDTLPPNATISAFSLPYTVDGEDIKWTLSDVPAGLTTTIDATLRYDIDRDGNEIDDGVADGRIRVNSVSVIGSPITTNSSGIEVSSGLAQPFINASDTATTTFARSTAIWGINITPTDIKYLSLNPSVVTKDVDYQIRLSGGDIALRDAVMIYRLPNHVSSVEDSDGGVVDLVNKTITWNLATLNTSTHYWNVTLRYDIDRDGDANDDGVAHGRTRENIIEIEGKAVNAEGTAGPEYVFVPSTSSAITTFEDIDVKWEANKSVGNPTYRLPFINVDIYSNNITYTLKLETIGDSSALDNIPVKSVTFTDDLPDYAELVSYQVVGSTPEPTSVTTSSALGAVLSFDFDNIPEGVEPEIQVTVKYYIDGNLSSDGVKIGTTQDNNFVVSNVQDGNGDPINIETGNISDYIRMSFIRGYEPQPYISLNIEGYNKNNSYNPVSYNQLNSSTYPGDRNYNIGNAITYILDFNNISANGVDLLANNTEINVATLPIELNYTQINLGQTEAIYGVNYDFYYTTRDNAEIKYGSFNTATAEVINVSSLGLIGDDYITSIRIVYTEDVPAGFRYKSDGKIKLMGTVKNETATKTDIYNHAQLSYQFMEFGSALSNRTKSDDVYFRVLANNAWISKLDKIDLTNLAEYNTRAIVDFRVKLETDALLATDGLIGPVIIDVVPTAFDSDTLVWNNDITWDTLNTGIPKPTMTVLENQPAIGQTLIIWSWANDYELPEGEDVTIDYSLDFHSYGGVGDHTNEIYLTARNAYLWGFGLSQQADTENYDGEVITTQRLVGNHETVTVMETPSLECTKWVMGELDDDYSRYPDVGKTNPGGLIDYKIQVRNNGNVPLNDIELIEILPYEGDTSVLAPHINRGSLWTPFLTAPLIAGEQQIVKDALNVESTAVLSVEYSTARNPYRWNTTGDNIIGSEEPQWSTTPPEDLSLVRSLRIRINDFNTLDETVKELEAGEIITFNISMRAPVGAPPASNPDEVDPHLQEATWNSISMTAKQDGSPDYLLRNEPLKVGIIIGSNPIGEIGDFVWFDKNGDGEQNDGYDDEYAGLNGITAILKNESHVELDRTITGDNDEGKPGFYLFPNLESGKYYVGFELPTYYDITTTNNCGTTIDSNGYLDGDTIRTELITINTSGADSQRVRHDIDLGVVDNAKIADITVTKAAIGYKETDDTIVMYSPDKVPVNSGETILYKVVVENTGELPLNNIRIKDNMDGFTFTKGDFIDKLDNKVAYTTFSEDPNATLNSNNEVILNKLNVGESYELYGEYTVLPEDENGTAIDNTVNVWANELKDQDSDDSYTSDDEAVDVAALSIEKTVTQLKKSGTSTFKDVADDVKVQVGDTLRYGLTVANTGSINLTDVRVVDAKVSLDTTIPEITTGNAITLYADYDVTEADESSGSIVNEVIVTQDKIREAKDDTHETDFMPKGLAVTKDVFEINGEAPQLYKEQYVAKVGDVITYSITLTNTQEEDLKNVKITKDDITSSNNDGNAVRLLEDILLQATLTPGAIVTYTVDYTMTADDIDTINTQTIHNVAYGQSDEITERDDFVDVELISLHFDKSADKTSYYYVGQGINYTLKVTNYGSIALNNVSVVDEKLELDEEISILNPGESVSFTKAYVVTIDDINNRSITNVAIASSSITGEVSDEVKINYRKKTTPTIVPEIPEEPEEEIQPEPETPKPEEITKKPDGTTIYDPPTGTKIVEIIEKPTHGTIVIDEENNVIYTPNEGAPSYDKFTIIINKDGEDILLEIEIFDEDVAGGLTELPETSGTSSYLFYIFGILIMGAGVYLKPKK